jgi:hypothetical protein
MATANLPCTNNDEYQEFDNEAGLREVAKACVGYTAADLSALVQRAATSGSRRLWGKGLALQAAVNTAPG